MLVSVSAQVGGLAFDVSGKLFVADGHSISKYASDGTKSTFVARLKYALGLCFDREGNLFVSDGAARDAKSRRSITFVAIVACTISCCFSNAQKIQTKGKHHD